MRHAAARRAKRDAFFCLSACRQAWPGLASIGSSCAACRVEGARGGRPPPALIRKCDRLQDPPLQQIMPFSILTTLYSHLFYWLKASPAGMRPGPRRAYARIALMHARGRARMDVHVLQVARHVHTSSRPRFCEVETCMHVRGGRCMHTPHVRGRACVTGIMEAQLTNDASRCPPRPHCGHIHDTLNIMPRWAFGPRTTRAPFCYRCRRARGLSPPRPVSTSVCE
jgi:hypothetical protein